MSAEKITSEFWCESAETTDPFVAKAVYCSGFNVFADLLPQASYIEYLFLLFKREKPTAEQAQLLNALAICLANPGPRDYSVQAAMSAGAGGSTAASALMAALAVGAGNYGGAREIFYLVQQWGELGLSLPRWMAWIAQEQQRLAHLKTQDASDYPARTDNWLPLEHLAGFHPYTHCESTLVQQCLAEFTKHPNNHYCHLLRENQATLTSSAQHSLSLAGVCAAALLDLQLNAEQAEMLFLLLRLPGAAVHGLEQRWRGWKDFPFYREQLEVLTP